MLGGRREREVVVSSRLRPHKVHERRTPPPAFNTHTHHPLHPNSLELLIQRGLQVCRKRRPRERLRARRRFGLHGGQLGLDFVEGLEHQAGQLVGGGGRGVAAGGGSAAQGDAGRGSEGREEWREGVSSQSSCHTAGELGSPVVCKGPASCALVFCFFRRRRAVWATTGKKNVAQRSPSAVHSRARPATTRQQAGWCRRGEGGGQRAREATRTGRRQPKCRPKPKRARMTKLSRSALSRHTHLAAGRKAHWASIGGEKGGEGGEVWRGEKRRRRKRVWGERRCVVFWRRVTLPLLPP